jgi:hypothetical protein
VNSEEIREFISNATFDTTMYFDNVGERDEFIEKIAAKWEADVEEQIEAAVKNAMSDDEIG